jgi:predicted secreted Zn-dependent protease
VGRAALTFLVAALGCYATPPLELGPKPAGVSVEARLEYYDVNAATLAEIRRAMQQSGPRVQGRAWSAVTMWRYHWSYQYDSRGTLCALRNVRVRMVTTIQFPRWNPTAEPDSALVEWWHQMNAGLAEHERGHAQLAMKTAGEIVQALDGMMGGRCPALGEQANAAGRRIVDAGNRRQSEYDATTRHGATQIQQARRLRDP